MCATAMAPSRLRCSTEQKLDMALEDLVDQRPRENNGWREDVDGPYDRREGGKGRTRRRVPPEDRALLNTYCYFDVKGMLVVRLYDTEVFTFKRAAGAVTEGDLKKCCGLGGCSAAGDVVEGATMPGSAPGDSTVAILTTGRFRTAETKYILNEAIRNLGYRIAEDGDAGKWMVIGPSGTPQQLEDGMELSVTVPITASEIRDSMTEKITEAKEREAGRRNPSQRHARREPGESGPTPPQRLPSPSWSHPPLPQYGPAHPHRPPPPGWPAGAAPGMWPSPSFGPPLMPSPPSWAAPWSAGGATRRLPPSHHRPRPPLHGDAASRLAATAATIGATTAPAPRGPLPDSMFQ